MNRWYLKTGTCLLGALLFSLPALALAASPYYKGKTVRLLVGFRPGGGTDLQARYFASRWPAFIPGQPRIVVTNLPPNIAAKNYLWKARPDGTTLLFVASGGVSSQFDKRARFKADRFNWIGAHASRDLLWLVRGDATDGPIENCPRKGAGQKLVLAVRDIESLTGKSLSAITLARWFKCSLRVVSVGRQGTADDLLMLERGEQNSWLAGSTWYALPNLRPGWLKEGYLRPFANMSHPDTPIKPNAELELKLPNVYGLLKSDQREVWESFHLSEVYAGKGIMTPPETSSETLTILRTAYENALADSKFVTGLERIMGQPVTFSRSSTLQKQTRQYLRGFKPELQKRLQEEALDYIGYRK